MCGIVGCVLKYKTGFLKQTEDSFMQMLYADALRGDDSTGVIGVEKDGAFSIMKEATPAAWFMTQFETSNTKRNLWNNGIAAIGHNRKKTIGDASDENAHPFVSGQFAMVHNGTLYDHKRLADTKVDSEALTQHLSKVFAKKQSSYAESLGEALGDVYGAYAVAMYDQANHHVRLIRNAERPLAWVETPNAWFFASEAGLLIWILSRNGYDMSKIQVKAVPVHTLISFDLEKATVKEETVSVKKALPPVSGASTKAPSKNISSNDTAFITKGELKKIRRSLLQHKISWWADDYVEKNFPKTEADGETVFTLMGECDKLMYDHMVFAEVDIAQFKLSSDQLVNQCWSGVVDSVSYDRITGLVNIYLRNTAPHATVIDDKYIQEKLDEQEKVFTTYH